MPLPCASSPSLRRQRIGRSKTEVADLSRLDRTEVEALNRSQFATGSQKHRDPRYPPFAFTEHGAIMAATILNSSRAVEMSLYVVRAFVRLRELMNPPEPKRRGIGFTADSEPTR